MTMTAVNTEQAKLQCEQMFNSLSALYAGSRLTDLHAVDIEQGAVAMHALQQAMEAFRKLRNGL